MKKKITIPTFFDLFLNTYIGIAINLQLFLLLFF